MANRLSPPNLFAGTSPPWQLSLLDQNASNVQSALNDSSLGFNNYVGADSGTANNYVLSLPVGAPSAYTAGMTVSFIPANSNTGSSTVTIAPLGSVAILNLLGNATQGGDIVAGTMVVMVSTGAAFRIVQQTASSLIGPAGAGYNFINQRVLYDDFPLSSGPAALSTPGAVYNGQLPWTCRFVGSNAAIIGFDGLAEPSDMAFGCISTGTGNTTSGQALLYLAALYTGLGPLEMDARFAAPTLPTSAQNFTVRFGLVDSGFAFANQLSLSGYFSAGSVVFSGNSTLASTTTTTSTVPWTQTSMIRIRIVVNAAWNSLTFFAGNPLVQIGAAITTNIPAGTALFPFLGITKSSGTVSASAIWDQFYLQYIYSSP
jgi:hypothetical protein